jgi:hypothetical protein
VLYVELYIYLQQHKHFIVPTLEIQLESQMLDEDVPYTMCWLLFNSKQSQANESV